MRMWLSSKFVSGSGLRSHAVEQSSLLGGAVKRSFKLLLHCLPCFSLRFARIKDPSLEPKANCVLLWGISLPNGSLSVTVPKGQAGGNIHRQY